MSDNGKRWQHLETESPELLSLCLKRIPALQQGSKKGGGEQHMLSSGISSIHLVDASWVWTEPHSRRLKVRLTVRATTTGGAGVAVQQRCLVELVESWKQCQECNREYTNRTWQAVVQLMQKRADGSSRRGLVLIEAALAKNADVRRHVLSVDPSRHGFDFYFLSLMHARLFSSYLSRVAPMRIKTTQKLVSTDVKSNTANVKHTVACDVVPLCRDDLLIVDKRVSSGGGGGAGHLAGRLCLVERMSSVIRLVDASPVRNASMDRCMVDIHPEKYWRGDKYYRLLFSSTRLTRFVVLDVELCADANYGEEQAQYAGPKSGVEKFALADVEIVRESDFGQTDETLSCVTHLGNLLQPGDSVLGYDLVSSVLPSEAEWSLENSCQNGFVMPDVVLVKKVKGSGGGRGDSSDLLPAGEEDVKKSKAKSSGSKKRERRRKKEEKKAKQQLEEVARMGFLGDGGDEGGTEELLKREREAFERELENDEELAAELNAVEEVLREGGKEMDRAEENAENDVAEEDDEGEATLADNIGDMDLK
jgi:nonsense-mediated mRNA decay protein 3